jgi:FHA domain
MDERAVLRLVLGYQEAWFAQFPQLSRRAEWHILHHLAMKGRQGVPAGEVYGLVKQVFLLDDATVKERLTAINQLGLCLLDPPGQVFARTVTTPTPVFLARFDAHLQAFVSVLAEASGFSALVAPAEVSAIWRGQVMRPLDTYQTHWSAAMDAIFDQTALSPARRSDARRHLMSPSHWNLLHTALRWHYEAAEAPVLADRLAARILDLTGQTVQTTKDHIGYLLETGIFQRMGGKALHVSPSAVTLHYVGWALRQSGSEVPGLLAPLMEASGPAVPVFAPAVIAPMVEAPMVEAPMVEAPVIEAEEVERTLNIRPVVERHFLDVVMPVSAAQRFELQSPITIGRAAPAEIVLPRSDVSRTHCRIETEGDRLVVSDLQSTNGTFVNDQRLTAPCVLQAGDRLRIGSFVLQYDSDAAAADRTQRGPAPELVATLKTGRNKAGNSAS